MSMEPSLICASMVALIEAGAGELLGVTVAVGVEFGVLVLVTVGVTVDV